MQNDALYQSVFRRASVRKYDASPMPDSELESARSFWSDIPPLWEGAAPVLGILPAGRVAFGIAGPHFAVAYTGEDTLSKMSAGYALEYLALYLDSRGYGACFNGVARLKGEDRQREGQAAVIPMVFGTPRGACNRGGIAEFPRKPLHEVVTGEVPAALAQALLVAPSAYNAQPWLLERKGDLLTLYYRPQGFKAKFVAAYAAVNLGCALAHLSIAFSQQQIPFRPEFDVAFAASGRSASGRVCTMELT